MDFEWGERLGRRACPYVRRWMIQTRFGSLRVHHWTGPDDSRAKHDHPWAFLTLVLKGSYIDDSDEGWDQLFLGSVRFRRANWTHRVVPVRNNCWTLVLTGPAKGAWGFKFPTGRRVEAEEYTRMMGQAPCSPTKRQLGGDRYGFPR